MMGSFFDRNWFSGCWLQGFVSAVENLREFVPAVYDMTVAVSKELPDPTMIRIFRGQPSVVYHKFCTATIPTFIECSTS